jgi:hypothetical protein
VERRGKERRGETNGLKYTRNSPLAAQENKCIIQILIRSGSFSSSLFVFTGCLVFAVWNTFLCMSSAKWEGMGSIVRQ